MRSNIKTLMGEAFQERIASNQVVYKEMMKRLQEAGMPCTMP